VPHRADRQGAAPVGNDGAGDDGDRRIFEDAALMLDALRLRKALRESGGEIVLLGRRPSTRPRELTTRLRRSAMTGQII